MFRHDPRPEIRRRTRPTSHRFCRLRLRCGTGAWSVQRPKELARATCPRWRDAPGTASLPGGRSDRGPCERPRSGGCRGASPRHRAHETPARPSATRRSACGEGATARNRGYVAALTSPGSVSRSTTSRWSLRPPRGRRGPRLGRLRRRRLPPRSARSRATLRRPVGTRRPVEH